MNRTGDWKSLQKWRVAMQTPLLVTDDILSNRSPCSASARPCPQVREEQRKAAADTVNFPCVLKIIPTCVFNKKDPIIVGVEVVSGIARVGTVLCVPSQGFIDLGRIASLEHNHKNVDKATKGQSVAMKIQPQMAVESSRAYGRHFDCKDELVSRVTRRSIDLLKEHFRDELAKEDWILLAQIKKKQENHYNEVI